MRFSVSVLAHMAFTGFVLVGVSALVSSQAFAGGNAGGGGGALVCPAGHPANVRFEGKEYTAQLLELYEARDSKRGHFTNPFRALSQIVRSSDPVEIQIDRALEKIKVMNSYLYRLLKLEQYSPQNLYKRRSDEDVSKTDKFILPPTDALILSVPIGCKIQGVGQYSDRFNYLEYDGKLLESMPKTDQAAFWLHEAIYAIFRKFEKSTDSIQTRVIVAQLFSDNERKMPNHRSSSSAVQLFCKGREEQVQFSGAALNDLGQFYLNVEKSGEINISIETRSQFFNDHFSEFIFMNTNYEPIALMGGWDGKIDLLDKEYLKNINEIIKSGRATRKLDLPLTCFIRSSWTSFGVNPKVCASGGASGRTSEAMKLKSGDVLQYVLINDNRILLPTKEKGVFKFNGKIGVQINGVDIDEGIKPGQAGYPEFFCRQI